MVEGRSVMAPPDRKRVCVIGAGVAGLVTAKVLAEDGFDVVVFEKEPEIGGVWTVSRTYPGLRANNSRDTYAFSDHPYPDSAAVWPGAPGSSAWEASALLRNCSSAAVSKWNMRDSMILLSRKRHTLTAGKSMFWPRCP